MDKSINRLLRRSDVENLCGVGRSLYIGTWLMATFPVPCNSDHEPSVGGFRMSRHGSTT